MIYTDRFHRAIRFCIKTHEVYQKQKRKGKDIPYIAHPLTVGMILAHAGCEESVVIAGILHDTIEDSVDEKKVTKEMLAIRFGNDVAELVDSVSEQMKLESWEVRKKIALDHIKDFSKGSILLKSADVIANVTELYHDYVDFGNETFSRFNTNKDRTVGHYLELVNELIKYYPESPLCDDLGQVKDYLNTMNIPSVI